jgi:hypothetical protein
MLQNFLNQIGTAPMGATAGQTGAVNQIAGEASGVPSFAAQGENTVNNLFGSNTNPQQAILANAYGQTAGALSPMLDPGYTNPMTNPNLGAAMNTLNSDITNQIGGEFAAAGRPVGTNADSAQAIARGVSQGESGLLANEFNTLTGNQLNAANQLTGAAGATAGGLTAQQQAALENQLQGIGASGAIPGMLMQPGMTQLGAAGLQAGLPTMNMQQLEALGIPIAGLGAQSQGTGTTTQQQSPVSNIMGGLFGGLGLLGGTGAFGSTGWLAPLMLSDERAKEDIKPVGMLYDETPVYSYRYKGDDTPRIGLIAQDVEKRRPDAVREFGGIKAVDYGKATERARMIGMLADLDMAA